LTRAGAALFPPATVLLSRAFWFARDHPGPVIGLGFLGAAPTAALLLLLIREAHESWLAPGAVSALLPLSFGVAAVFFLRFPLRLALARWMAQESRGEPASVPSASLFGLVHLPTALFYGGLSTLGWLLGAVFAVPLILAFQGTLALHRFAATDLSAWAALQDARQIPVGALGLKLLGAALVLTAALFLVLWTTPQALLGLAEWLFRADVIALREVLGVTSPPWGAAALVLAGSAVELLWTLAFGLVSADWQRLAAGSDLAAALDVLEARGSGAAEAFD
jgi:hypothetical protein